MEWAVAQTLASVDYSHDSWWTTFCCGALNFQIVHHLLPSVSQYHYPAIAPIIMRVAARHGVKYNCLPNFYEAFYHHVAYLYKLGQSGTPIPLETSLQ
jgi:fatty acid desaturase